MKKSYEYLILLLLFLSLSACKPTEEDIQFAIFQTEMANQENSGSGINSQSPSPTNTAIITPTVKKPLHDLVVSLDDINTIIPTYYETDLTEVDLNWSIEGAVDVFTGFYWGEVTYGNLSILLIEFNSNEKCLNKLNYEKSKNSDTGLTSSGNIELPKNAFVYAGKEGNVVWVDLCQSRIFMDIGLYIPTNSNPQEYVLLTEALAQKQLLRLQEAGY